MTPTTFPATLRRTRTLDGRAFADGALIEPDDPRRAATEGFIAQVYRARYDAQLAAFLPHLLAFRNAEGGL
jgi:hypothetical protein